MQTEKRSRQHEEETSVIMKTEELQRWTRDAKKEEKTTSIKTGKTCEAVSEGKEISVIVHANKKHGIHILALVGKEKCITFIKTGLVSRYRGCARHKSGILKCFLE